MHQFVHAGLITRENLLKGKAQALGVLCKNFLLVPRDGDFMTEWGTQTLNDLLAEHDIQNTDDSVMAFAQNVVGECVALLCFQTGEDNYKFYLVSGSKDEIRRMTRRVKDQDHDSPSRNQNISIER